MKKRILSLILALSMVLSVLPLGAFAADPPELVMKDGRPDTANVQKTSFTDSDGKTKDKYTGSDWEYTKDPSDSTDTGILTLTRGEYDFSNTNPKTKTGSPTNQAVACAIVIESGAEITGGTFNGQVANEGTIKKGTFNGDVANEGTKATIKDGTFNGDVTNEGTIKKGTFAGEVTNLNTIEDGTFNGKVSNNQGGNITNGTFEQEVINNDGGGISGGTFKGTVSNGNGIITGGTFAAGLSRNDGSVTGGAFNGKTGLTTKAHQVTVTNGSVSQVNGVDPRNADGTTGTAWDLYAYKGTTVIITADTEIFSLNGYPHQRGLQQQLPLYKQQEDCEIHHAVQRERGAQHRRTRHGGRLPNRLQQRRKQLQWQRLGVQCRKPVGPDRHRHTASVEWNV